MRAFVLAAGFGTRMEDLTKDRPKPLLPLGGRPLLDYSLFWLHRWGVREAVLNLHYHGGLIRRHLKKFPHFSIHFSEEREILGTAGGVRTGLDLFQERESPLILMNPDTILLPAEEDAPFSSQTKRFDACLYLKAAPPGSGETRFSSFEEEGLRKGCEPIRKEEGGKYYYMGYAVIDPRSLDSLAPHAKAELGPLWVRAGERGDLRGRLFRGECFDAGTRQAYEALNAKEILPPSLREEWGRFVRGWGEEI